jgi:hypothetical protein
VAPEACLAWDGLPGGRRVREGARRGPRRGCRVGKNKMVVKGRGVPAGLFQGAGSVFQRAGGRSPARSRRLRRPWAMRLTLELQGSQDRVLQGTCFRLGRRRGIDSRYCCSFYYYYFIILLWIFYRVGRFRRYPVAAARFIS